MKSLVLRTAILVAGSLLLLPAGPAAQDSGGRGKRGSARKEKKEAEIPEAMKAYIAMSRPGAEHKALAPLVGAWHVVSNFTPAPGAPTETSKATSRVRWLLGRRFIQEDFRGRFMGVAFQGLGLTGYDKVKKAYTSIWTDSMSTGFMLQTGHASKDGKVIKFSGKAPDPESGEIKTWSSVLTIHGPDKHVFEMFMKGPDGKTFKNMELIYTRKAPRARKAGSGQKRKPAKAHGSSSKDEGGK